MAASRKRTQEEKNLRTLRELASLPANKQCFDCHQRGPTYVNMTVGSFVCTSCSGMLRGLNPPHRVKSITMTVFTPEEIEFIRNKGNEYCRYVWLGTYDTRSLLLEPEPRDEQKVKDFMIQKYERKRWYVDPDKAVRNMQDHFVEDHSHHSGLQSATSSSGPSSQSSTPQSEHMPETKPLSNLLGRNAPPLVVHNSPAPLASSSSWINPNTLTNTRQNMAQEKSVDSLFGSPDFFGTPNPNQVSNVGILGSSQSVSQTANSVSYSIANGNFANFENAFNDSATPTAKSFGMFSPVSSSSTSSTFSNAFENVTSPPSTIASPIQPTNQPQQVHPPPADRYSALADLDSLFHQEQPSQSVTPPAPVSSWVTTNTTVTLTNNNNNSSSLFGNPQQQQQQQNSLFSAATANPFTSTTSTWSSANNGVNPNQAVFQANPFQQAQVANPTQQSVGFGQFGLNNQPKVLTGPVIDNYTNYSQIPPANMQQVYFNNTQGLIGSPNGIPSPQYQQNGGLAYHWGGNAPNQVTSNNIWGMCSSPDAITAALQNPKMNNSGLGPQSIQTPANPFMSNAVSNAPRSNPGNPFL